MDSPFLTQTWAVLIWRLLIFYLRLSQEINILTSWVPQIQTLINLMKLTGGAHVVSSETIESVNTMNETMRILGKPLREDDYLEGYLHREKET